MLQVPVTLTFTSQTKNCLTTHQQHPLGLSTILEQSITPSCPSGCSTEGSETGPALGMLLHSQQFRRLWDRPALQVHEEFCRNHPKASL